MDLRYLLTFTCEILDDYHRQLMGLTGKSQQLNRLKKINIHKNVLNQIILFFSVFPRSIIVSCLGFFSKTTPQIFLILTYVKHIILCVSFQLIFFLINFKSILL